MIKSLLFISIAPIIIVALYIYIRDRYEKEPIIALLKTLLSGVIIVLPVVVIEGILGNLNPFTGNYFSAFYNGFLVASLTEEGFKFMVFMLLCWRSSNFNERFDGIVYAVFISLGFAAIENIIYVHRGGYEVGILRALTAVPAHAFFGTVMGYHLGNAKFYHEKRGRHIMLAFIMPFTWHGLYDFLLLGEHDLLLLVFIPVVIYFWINGLKKMKELSTSSVFRNDFPVKGENRDFQDRG